MAKIIRYCIVEDCGKKYRTKGYCQAHYQKWIKYEDPLYVVDLKKLRKKIAKKRRGKKNSRETRKKISESLKGKEPWNKGKKMSKKTRKKISKSLKGKQHSEKTKHKMSETRKANLKMLLLVKNE